MDRLNSKSKYAISGRVTGKRKTSQELESDKLKRERILGSKIKSGSEDSVFSDIETGNLGTNRNRKPGNKHHEL